MDLYFLRHAVAVKRGTPGYKRDSDRELTPKGRRTMYRVAKGMVTLGLEFDAILTSQFKRAQQTAEIVAEMFDAHDTLRESNALAVGGDPGALVDEIRKKYPAAQRLLLVGHEPHMSNMISVFLTGSSNLSLTMKKAGLCKLKVGALQYGQCATLEWLLTPAQLVFIG